MNHMNSKTVMGLGVATVIALLAAAAINSGRKPHIEGSQEVRFALPELRDHVNDVKAISLSGAGHRLLATLEKNDKGWSLKEKGGYPVDAGKVREFLLKLSEARLLEQKTANAQRYGELGVSDISADDAKGVLVAFDGLAKPLQLIVGNVSTRGDATYLRRVDDKQSWLAKGNIAPDKTPANWLDKTVADIPATRVQEVLTSKPDGKPLRVFKTQRSDNNYAVADLPKGRELSSEFAANALGTTLAGLNADDVSPAAEAAPPADGKVYKAKFTTFDGLALELVAWKREDKALVQLHVTQDAASTEAAVVAAQAKAKADWEAQQAAQSGSDAKPADSTAAVPPLAVSDPAKDKSERLAALNDEVAKLTQRATGWTFVLPAHKFENLNKSVDDLLKPLEDKKAKASAKALPATP